MIKKNLVFAWRTLKRNILISSINVLGLTIGLSAFLVMSLIVNYELSFDKFQPDRDRVYRIYSTFSGVFSGVNRGVPTGFAGVVRDEFTGIESVCNFHSFGSNVKIKSADGRDKNFDQYNKIILADESYFSLFNIYEWLEGDATHAMSKPHQVVLTASRGKTYFGDIPFGQMIGREIHYRDSLVVTVSGIVKDIEQRTDFDFTDFISLSTVENSWLKQRISLNDWHSTNSNSQLFIKASEGTTQEKIDRQMKRLESLYAEKNKDVDWLNTPMLQPLSDLHFDTSLGIFDGSRSVPERTTLQFMMGIAFLLLLIASINFINLETAQASRRAKEVGVKKVLGSSRGKLVAQFLTESFLLTLCAVITSIAAVSVIMDVFSEFIPQGLILTWTDATLWIFIAICLVVVTLLAGLYPAFVLSSYRPALALKNITSMSNSQSRSATVRKLLTVFQFSFSQILIIATLAVAWQIQYMLNKDLGFSSDSIVYFRVPWWEDINKRNLLKHELEKIREIEVISLHNSPPSSNGFSSSTLEFNNGKEILKHNVYRKVGDTAYLKLYDIKLLAGRNLLPSDTAAEYLINETYMKQLGFKNPADVLGKTISHKPIVGVVKDFHSRSLHNAIDPMVIFSDAQNHGCFGLKLYAQNNRVGDLQPILNKIDAAWKKVYGDNKLEYSFMDDAIMRFYETEQRISKLAKTATAIAVLISCLGLFGLSSFTVIQRTKEIGIRKVLGATISSILILLSKDFLKLVVVAFAISAPLAYYISDRWLQDFAYRINIDVWIFVMAGLSSLLTAFLTISFKTVNAAKADPVKSLRYE